MLTHIKLLKPVQNAHGRTPRGAIVRWSRADMESLVDAGKAIWHAAEAVADAVRLGARIRPRGKGGD